MKRSTFFCLGLVCTLMMSLISVSSYAQKSSNENRGILAVYETYDASQFLPIMEAIDESTKGMDRQLWELLSGMTSSHGPVVGVAFYRDTTAINAILNSKYSKSLLPSDLRFAWTAYPESPRSGLYRLIALKTRNSQPAMHGDLIQNAKVEIEPLQNEVFVIISFNEKAAKEWAYFTKSNIGRSIAMVVDGKVYCYPTVHEEITGGNGMIYAPWDEEDAKELAKKLMSK